MSSDTATKSQITLHCGAATPVDVEIAPDVTTVGEIRKSHTDIMGIGKDTKAIVRGNVVADTYPLASGDTLEFIKPSGSKGQ